MTEIGCIALLALGVKNILKNVLDISMRKISSCFKKVFFFLGYNLKKWTGYSFLKLSVSAQTILLVGIEAIMLCCDSRRYLKKTSFISIHISYKWQIMFLY